MGEVEAHAARALVQAIAGGGRGAQRAAAMALGVPRQRVHEALQGRVSLGRVSQWAAAVGARLVLEPDGSSRVERHNERGTD